MAECYRLECNYDEAFHYYDQAIIYNRSRGYYPGAAVFYTNYGVAAYQKGEQTVARQLFNFAADIYQSSHECSEYPIALSYLALYDVIDGDFNSATNRLQEALHICELIGSPWWYGITIYLTWIIRDLLDKTRYDAPALRMLWPESRIKHCEWGLSYLRKLQPRQETAEIEQALQSLLEQLPIL